MAYTFGGQVIQHPALLDAHDIASDIYTGLFDWFFKAPEVESWRIGKGEWQLHCVGGPGAGKTTLAALAPRILRNSFEAEVVRIATLFVTADVSSDEDALLEDLLRSIYFQLNEPYTAVGDPSLDIYKKYVGARTEAKSAVVRIALIRKALHIRIACTKLNFFVFDGLDRCSKALRMLLARELDELRMVGLRIMITSRLPVFNIVYVRCDHKYHGQFEGEEEEQDEMWVVRDYLNMYLQCSVCQSVMCFDCKNNHRICGRCGNNDGLREPYDHVTFLLDPIGDIHMTPYISWDLEREHGDLGLDTCVEKPPPSELGLALRADRADAVEDLIDKIVDQAGGNIGLAKARLDVVHKAQSVAELEGKHDQLPANIVSLFDAGVQKIQAQPHHQRNIGLQAIAAAGRDFYGTPISQAEKWLLLSKSESNDLFSTRSFENVLEAANGFLNIIPIIKESRLHLYHTSFQLYVEQRYNKAIHKANSKLKTSRPSLNVMSSKPTMDTVAEHPADEPPQILPQSRVRDEPGAVEDDDPRPGAPLQVSQTTTGVIAPQQLIFRRGTRPWDG